VDLADQIAVARRIDVAVLEQDFEVGRPAFLALVAEVLRDYLFFTSASVRKSVGNHVT
jgi:hypothetical protein